MAAFTLGASPAYFAVIYFATQLGKNLERRFTQVAAVLILVAALFTIDGGLTLAGAPVFLTHTVNFIAPWTHPLPAGVASGESARVGDGTALIIQIKNSGYEPRTLHAKAGEAIRVQLISKDVYSCSLSFVISALGIQENMKPNDEAWIDIPAQPAGTDLPFSCSMGMFTGSIVFDL